MGMDRPRIEPSPSRMLSGCDTTTPTAPELSRRRVLKYPLRIAFSAEAVQRERPATKASLPALALAAERKRKETKGVRRQQKGRLEAERAGPHSFAHSENQPKECGPARSASSLPFCCRRNCPRRRRAWAWTGRGLSPPSHMLGVMPLHQLPLS